MALIKLFDHIYSDSVKQCLSIFNGSIFDGDLMELNELSKDDNLAIFLPYTDLEEEGTFKNIYTNSAFNNSLFSKYEPDGNRSENCLGWRKWNNKIEDVNCEEPHNSLCEPGNILKPFNVRGLCSKSKIDTKYYLMLNGWRSLGHKKSFIKYNGGINQLNNGFLQLKIVNSFASATVNVRNDANK